MATTWGTGRTKTWGTPGGAGSAAPGGLPSVGGGIISTPRPPSDVNPYDAAFQDTYKAAMDVSTKTGDDYTKAIEAANQGVDAAGQLVGKDYTADLNRMAQAEIDKQQTAQGNQFGALGMRELGLRDDVQENWADTRTDAATKAAIDAQAMQAQALAAQNAALQTLTATLNTASGDELEALSVAISAASAGGSNYNQYADLNADLLAAGGGGNTSGGARQSGVY